jgi:hypothetical protein
VTGPADIRRTLDLAPCWAMADDEDPDCPIGSARCVLDADHDGEHVFEARS